ncbi:hypothetical protein LL974_03335 [Xanthomonas campestris pv. cannae]|nr:hypothetical protein [Xanthomonas campestris pv. cannae]
MIASETTPLIIGLAKDFISVVSKVDPAWDFGYFRFSLQDSYSESKASCAYKSGVEIIDVLKFKYFFHEANAKGREILSSMGKSEGVFLLVIDSKFNYEIKFEYTDMDKWRISKIGGGTGIPVGLY